MCEHNAVYIVNLCIIQILLYVMQLKGWYKLTKCPTVALTLIGGKIYYLGEKY